MGTRKPGKRIDWYEVTYRGQTIKCEVRMNRAADADRMFRICNDEHRIDEYGGDLDALEQVVYKRIVAALETTVTRHIYVRFDDRGGHDPVSPAKNGEGFFIAYGVIEVCTRKDGTIHGWRRLTDSLNKISGQGWRPHMPKVGREKKSAFSSGYGVGIMFDYTPELHEQLRSLVAKVTELKDRIHAVMYPDKLLEVLAAGLNLPALSPPAEDE